MAIRTYLVFNTILFFHYLVTFCFPADKYKVGVAPIRRVAKIQARALPMSPASRRPHRLEPWSVPTVVEGILERSQEDVRNESVVQCKRIQNYGEPPLKL